MKRNRRQDNPQGLEPLASQARDYALHMMHTTGSVPPTVIADTEEGYVFCMPADLADDAAKDRFADVTRLFAIAQAARSLVMVVEAWARLPDANGHLDTDIPPSQAPDRKEVVVLMLEDHSRNATSMLPILRDDGGTFTGFGDPGPLLFGDSKGRFSDLMPRNKPSVREAAQVRHCKTAHFLKQFGPEGVKRMTIHACRRKYESGVTAFPAARRHENLRKRRHLNIHRRGSGFSSLGEWDPVKSPWVRASLQTIAAEAREELPHAEFGRPFVPIPAMTT